jgi:hypothetical protein
MSLNGSQRRDQRRRLVVSWKRSASGPGTAAAAEPRSMAAYGPEAHPEKQQGPATLVPTGLGGFAIAAVAILLPMAAALALAAAEPVFGRAVFAPQGRFSRSIQAAAACFDPRSMQSLAGWLAQVSLGLATAVALIVRLMRRHRRDDYNGRYRAWGWLAGLFLVTSFAGVVPCGRLIGALISDATGVTLGPGGIGWWIALAVVAYGSVTLWAVLPLHERSATAIWLALALLAWAGAAAGHWMTGRDAMIVAAQAAWALGASLAAIAMLAAARSVIREVRGQCRPAAAPRRGPAAREPVRQPREEEPAEEVNEFTASAEDATTGDDDTAYVDGSEPEHRHLSKAERKRLKKLARMNRVAA